MCDYSLHSVSSRPARAGDKLVTTSFPNSITRGFAGIDDPAVAVCLLPGTELAFENDVRWRRPFFGLFQKKQSCGKLARFRQVNPTRANSHHDAVEFPDGKVVLLTDLRSGQLATVLQLPVTTPLGRGDRSMTDHADIIDLEPIRSHLFDHS
jgi:hypothetical protein